MFHDPAVVSQLKASVPVKVEDKSFFAPYSALPLRVPDHVEPMDRADFLGITFSVGSHEQWLTQMFAPRNESFEFLVTPNVDHFVRLSQEPDALAAYQRADWCMCDSQIIDLLAGLQNTDLMAYPGADLVRDMLNDPRSANRTIAVVGPQPKYFERLRQRFPNAGLMFVEAPMMQPGCTEWQKTIERIEQTNADLTLLCLSFPKQEFMARDLKDRNLTNGRAICCGASVDFLTGRQKRAPKAMRQLRLEWLYRLLSNPRRLWRRYLVVGPRIFAMFLKDQRNRKG